MTDKKNEAVDTPQGVKVSDVVDVAVKLSKWKTYALYALLAVVAIQGGVIIWQRGNVAKAELAVANKDKEMVSIILERDVARGNDKTCRLNLADQSAKITEAGKRYTVLQGEMAELERRIANGDFYKPADNVRNQATPKSCAEALDFMNRNFP